MRSRWLGVLVLATLSAVEALAQPFGPSGPAFRVDAGVGGALNPDVATDGNGAFLIVWEVSDGSSSGVFGQRYSKAGSALGATFRVNTFTTNSQYLPTVTGSGNGIFTVAWESIDQISAKSDAIYAQRYSAGAPQGGEFRLDAMTTGYSAHPRIASDGSGNFVVVWDYEPPMNPNADTFGQRYAVSGAPQGAQFRVNTYTTYVQEHPVVARASGGAFVVVLWGREPGSTASYGMIGQRFAATGAPQGAPFVANTDTAVGTQNPGAVSMDAAGDFVVAWSRTTGLHDSNVLAQRYAASGAALGGNFQVNTYTSGYQRYPLVASDSTGNFVVAWEGAGQDGSGFGIFAQRYASTGAPLGAEFLVNAFTTGDQFLGGLASDTNGNFVVTWTNRGTSPYSIEARRYCASLAGDANGDGTLNVSDVFYLINALFAGGPAPLKPSDANGDGKADVGDVFYLINFLFAGGPGPACP